MSGEFGPGDEVEPAKDGKLDIMGRLTKIQLYYTMIGELEDHPEMQDLLARSQKSPEIVQQSEIEDKAKEILRQKLAPFDQKLNKNGLTVGQACDSIVDGYLRVVFPSTINGLSGNDN